MLRLNRKTHNYKTVLVSVLISILFVNSAVAKPADEPDSFRVPLRFPPELNNIQLSPPSFSYNFSKKTHLIIGNTQFSPSAFKLYPFKIRTTLFNESFQQVYTLLGFTWPQSLIDKGTLKIYRRNGTLLYKTTINASALRTWTQLKTRVLTGQSLDSKIKIKNTQIEKKPLLKKSNFGLLIKNFALIRKMQLKPIQFCVENRQSDSFSKVCSPFLKFKNERLSRPLSHLVDIQRFELFDHNQPATQKSQSPPLSGRVTLSQNKLIEYKLKLENGLLIQGRITPQTTHIEELVFDPILKVYKAWGYGARPYKAKSVAQPTGWTLNGLNSLYETIGWGATINAERFYWELQSPKPIKIITLSKLGVDATSYFLTYSSLPLTTARISLSKNALKKTYYSSVQFEPQLQKKSEKKFQIIKTKKYDQLKPTSKNTWTWTANNIKQGLSNPLQLNVIEKKPKKTKTPQTWVAQHHIFRGPSVEFSARGSTVIDQALKTSFLAEGSALWWFEKLPLTNSYYFSRHRWGLSARYFNSLSKLGVSDESIGTEIRTTNVDLKYRLLPGIWNYDPTWGFMLSYQNSAFDEFSHSLLGAGVFWARSMPKIFDSILNIIPFFRYPKWVDMEFQYYPYSPDKTATIDTTFNLNFHGKILWSRRFFGEAGFGVKSYNQFDQEALQRINISIFYVTAGLGLHF